ncbi:peptidase C14 [Rhizoclosmatium globosum]|uniref:Peptidase C14 n=1 Tax=Rhizoclosmatium globosum TaxID=329046 RepID=A0A1Y2C0I2_9FUNG|nr:peptidase C14 [Rhizoclosmatium globosum]|eukprot:ORY40486.1 peptidase C14 [Rhizoclosmatium globosum]
MVGGYGQGGRKKALLIGINYTGTDCELGGCINDANNLKKLLLTKGYKDEPHSMLLLTDDQEEDMYQPTTANILGAINWLLHGAQAGDTLWFSYSGHGGQIEDQDGDRENGLDDTICPVDGNESGQIDSDTLHRYLYTNLPPNVKLVVLMDCCHSGTLLELPYSYMPTEDGKMDTKKIVAHGVNVVNNVVGLFKGGFSVNKLREAKKVMDDVKQLTQMLKGSSVDDKGYKKENFLENAEEPAKEVYMIAGCIDDGTSTDAWMKGKATGALTFAFLSTIKKNPSVTFEQLLASLREFMVKEEMDQIPQLSCGHTVDPQTPFTF